MDIKFLDIYTIEEFVHLLKIGCINSFDGIGYYSKDGKEETNTPVHFDPDLVLLAAKKKGYRYVFWYNK